MKTFREFIAEANKHGIDADLHSKWLSDAEKAYTETGTIKGISQQTHNGINYVLRPKGYYKNGRPRFAITPKDSKKETEEKRQAMIKDLSSKDDIKEANKKARKLSAVKLEVHHITPLEKSAELKASMSPEQWAERVRRDAEEGIYHGHHHKNLMGAVGPKTPAKRRIRTAIAHTAAHNLEKEAEDFLPGHVHGKSLLAAGKRRELEKHVGPFQSTLLRREREKEREANK
jgi:hypothetical protein